MIRIAILDDYQNAALEIADWKSLGADCSITVFDRSFTSEEEAAGELEKFDVLCLMRERMSIGRSLIQRLSALKLIVVTGGRFRCVDLDAARENGVVVCSSGGVANASAAELAMGLVLAVARHIPQEDARLRAGGWQHTIGMLLEGNTLGILGLGRFGARMAKYGHAFGMKVVAWSPNLTAHRTAEHEVDYLPRERFFAESDVISIHLVLSETTRGLVGNEELALMKSTGILVNTSRGPIIDEAALVEALEARAIGGAGLDVFDREPLPLNHRLTRLDNVVLTPHIGFVNSDSYRGYYRGAVEAIAAWRQGRPIRVHNS